MLPILPGGGCRTENPCTCVFESLAEVRRLTYEKSLLLNHLLDQEA